MAVDTTPFWREPLPYLQQQTCQFPVRIDNYNNKYSNNNNNNKSNNDNNNNDDNNNNNNNNKNNFNSFVDYGN